MVTTDMSPSRGSYFTCRNVIVLALLLFIIIWYLPKLHKHSMTTADGWSMYPRDWVSAPGEAEPYPQHAFSVVTYNVLNSGFIVPGTYTYCPPELIDLRNRHPRIMVEVETMQPDIISMMEVDTEYYTDQLNPDMLKLGYNGVMGADQRYMVGQATFWKKEKFQLLHREYHFFHDLAKKYIDDAVLKKTLKPEEKETFSNWLKRRSLILITHLQEVSSGAKVIVGAVHITWDILQLPALQMLEVALGLQALQDLSRSTGTGAVIMMGDYNTPPHFPAYSFLRDGRVTETMRKSVLEKTDKGGILTPDYRRFGKSVLDILPEAFQHQLHLASAYHTVTGHEPEITNADDFDTRAGVQGVQTYTLDYIWYTDTTLRIHGALRTPPRSVILQHTGLPSQLFPSDHLPLKATFSVKKIER